MKELPLVTVITPSYNHEKFVEQSVLSVINQTYKNIEYLVFDDGSSDSTPDKIDALQKQHGFYFEKQKNMGVILTINKAILMAKGKYICFCASDDIWLSDKIEKQVDFLESRPDIPVCAGYAHTIDSENNIKQRKVSQYKELDFASLWNKGERFLAITAIIRKEIYDKVGLYNPEIHIEDLYMWLKITKKGYKIAILPQIVAYYRDHPTNSMKNHNVILENRMKIFLEYKDEPDYNEVINDYYLKQFVDFSKINKKIALEFLLKMNTNFFNKLFIKGLLLFIFPIPILKFIKARIK